jgi:hypothetical protein
MTGIARRGSHADRLIWLSSALAVASTMAGLLTLLAPGLLSGPAVMNGSARGTALVVVLVAVPTLLAGTAGARRGYLRALAMATGATAYLLYNAVLLVFATPVNGAFLIYEAMLGLAIFTLVGLGLQLWRRVPTLTEHPPRWVAAFMCLVVGLNLLAWLSTIVPALIHDRPRSMVSGIGLTTNPVYAQDLAFWLPAIAWLGFGVWQRHPPRVALASAALCFWMIESIGVAVDQWWGHHADPSSSVASGAAVPLFVAMAVVTAWPLLRLLRCLPASAGARGLGLDTRTPSLAGRPGSSGS